MSLYERYELLDLNRDDGVKTFEAREIATGRPVKVHLFVRPAAPLQAALLKAIDRLSETDLQRIVERGKHEGTPYVVTDRLPDYPGLSEWVQAASHQNKSKPAKPVLETAGAWKVQPDPPPPPPAPPAPVALPEESALNRQFVELFTTAERPVVADSLVQSAQRPQSAAPVRPPEPVLKQVQAEPGEFTRMFQAPAVAAPPAPAPAPQAQPEVGEFTKMFQAPKAPPAPPPAPAPASAPVKEPGEFTRMFQASPSPAAAPPPPAATKSGPGDFEQLFETRSPAGPMPHSPAVQQPLTPQAPGGSGPNRIGEFTQTFGKDRFDPAPAPPAAAPAPKEPGEFTRMFHSPGAAGPLPVTPPVTPQATPAAPPAFAPPPPAAPPIAAQPSGPGEYTRQFSAPAQLTFGQAPPNPAAPPAPSPQAYAPPAMAQPAMPNMAQAPMPPKKSNLVLILGVVGIVVVIALLVVFFVMRPK